MIEKLRKLLNAEVIEMTTSTYEIIAKAPAGHVWVDNGQDEICDSQWEGETRTDVKRGLAERMSRGLTKLS